MSNTYGLARKATSIAVRVLNAGGSGSVALVISQLVCSCPESFVLQIYMFVTLPPSLCSGVIAGINYVATDGSGKKSVAK